METKDVPRLTCPELKELLERQERLVIVDTRTNSSYARGHIPGAVNICYDLAEDPTEREMRLSTLPADVPLVIYCD